MKLGSSIHRRRSLGRGMKKGEGASPIRFWNRWKKTESGERSLRWDFLKEPRTLGLLGILAVVGFAGGYIISTRVVYPPPPPPGDLSMVPDLTGETPIAAADTLGTVGLALGSIDSLNHPLVPAGLILGQSPLPGQLSLVGDTVRIALSTGPEQRPVPDVLRLRGDRARMVLETSGFVVSVDSVQSDDPRGGVVSMTPEPGTEATIPMDVRLSVSMGPPEFEMPLLLGLPEEEARAACESLGLEVGDVEIRFRFGRDQGLVVEQEPPARTLIQKGSMVRLVVGRRGG